MNLVSAFDPKDIINKQMQHRLTPCLKSDLASLTNDRLTGSFTTVFQIATNVSGLCIIKLAGPGTMLLLEVFTALAHYKHSFSNLSCAHIHHAVDIRDWIALLSVLSLHDKWLHIRN